MKNIFIGGVAKSGKSTFAKQIIQEEKYNHIPLDYFASSFKHNFPQCNITSNPIISEQSSANFSLFLSKVMSGLQSIDDELFILDSAHILPVDIKNIANENWQIYFVGYPNITVEQKLRNIRLFETDKDWTSRRSNEELCDILENLIKLSKVIREQCKRFGFNFIDTSDLNFDITKKTF